MKIKEIFILYDSYGVIYGFALSKEEAVKRGFSEEKGPLDVGAYYKKVQR